MNSDGKIQVCPDCGSSSIRRSASRDAHEPWWCTDCGEKFAEPAYREPNRTGGTGPNTGMAADIVGLWEDEEGNVDV